MSARITCPSCRGRSWSELAGDGARCLGCGTEYRRGRGGEPSREQLARDAEWLRKLAAWGLGDLLPTMTFSAGRDLITHEFPREIDAERFCRKLPDDAPYDVMWEGPMANGAVTVGLHDEARAMRVDRLG